LAGITLILLCAGNSTRFELHAKKQWLRIENQPLWLSVANRFKSYSFFDHIIIASSENELNYMQNFTSDFTFVAGGDTRQASLKNALALVKTSHVMVTDVARSCVPEKVIENLLLHKEKAHCIVPVLSVNDTVIYDNKTIDRNTVKLIQTPQLSHTDTLKEALKTCVEYTDDSSAIKASGNTVHYIEGSAQSKKLTVYKDLQEIACLKAPSKNFFTGIGLDIHAFEENKPMVLGGIHIDANYGFKAHSDGDVLIHSVIDALLGAAGAGDIGEFFPDTDAQYKNADSKKLLEHITAFIYNVGYEIVNVDVTIIAQKPKINPHKYNIKHKMAQLLHIEPQFINIKATTAEKLGFLGRSEGVAVQSIATLKYFDWKNA
jgi:2-C-methyl-D-erythritol 4-phosphate cytidylyltransferase/2-C-methyl-D-erythritol 2,4-cyclodiphosphate synthase